MDIVLGTVRLRAPDIGIVTAIPARDALESDPEMLPGRVTFELRHLQVMLGAQIPYKAAALLRMLLPPMGGTMHTTTPDSSCECIHEDIRQDIPEHDNPDSCRST